MPTAARFAKHIKFSRHYESGLLKTYLVDKQFSVLKKWRSKFDCLIFEMLFIKELNPKLNTQKDPIRAKLFTWLCVRILHTHYHYIFSLFIRVYLAAFTFYSCSHFTHFWLENDVKWTSERRRIFKLLTKMVLNFLNFSTLWQFFRVKLFNKSLVLRILNLNLGKNRPLTVNK